MTDSEDILILESPNHEQLPFLLANGDVTEVDAGLYELMIALRDLGVKTQYSCQGTDEGTTHGKAYVIADEESFRPVIDKLFRVLCDTGIHQALHPEYVPPLYQYGEKLFGPRLTVRWHPADTRNFLQALNETDWS